VTEDRKPQNQYSMLGTSNLQKIRVYRNLGTKINIRFENGKKEISKNVW
jgi:hypothetical protein